MTFTRFMLLLLIALSPYPVVAAEDQGDIDPWEPMNRRIFSFNESLDEYVLLPAAKGYRFVMPDPAEKGVTNFISNVYEFNSIFNSLLQGRPGNALQSTARFLVNSTVGLLGLIDVATPMGIEHSPADFGQTLYTWGVDSGPYVVLPMFGPRTVRGSAGYLVDTYTSLPGLPGVIEDREWAYLFWAVEAVDLRANLIDADELVTGDRYIFIRNAYLQRREFFLTGELNDSFTEQEQPEDYLEF
ncbi:putative phospholipid-binding lipoprotein MlaA [Halioglobus japonicus]|nr:putative phospholipid-binding lipoprotein MlaA [Halioglobus japonicus]